MIKRQSLLAACCSQLHGSRGAAQACGAEGERGEEDGGLHRQQEEDEKRGHCAGVE